MKRPAKAEPEVPAPEVPQPVDQAPLAQIVDLPTPQHPLQPEASAPEQRSKMQEFLALPAWMKRKA